MTKLESNELQNHLQLLKESDNENFKKLNAERAAIIINILKELFAVNTLKEYRKKEKYFKRKMESLKLKELNFVCNILLERLIGTLIAFEERYAGKK